MTRATKRNLAILSTLLSLCICCGGFGLWFSSFVGQIMVTTPAEVRKIGREIADYTVPDGYSEVAGVQFLGARSISIANDLTGLGMMITLVQAPPTEGASRAEMERQLVTLTQRFNFQAIDLHFDRTESGQIDGQEVDLTYYTGSDQAGEPYRQMTALFRGKDGPTLIIAQSPVSTWDQTALDSFLASIH